MNVVTVANQKGGVGKTTTAVSMAGLLASQGQRVLLVDLDPQGSMTSYFKHDPDTIRTGVYSLFEARAAGTGVMAEDHLLVETGVPGLSLMPGCTAMATLDRQLGTREGMGLVIREALDRLSSRFDWVFMDCPPMLGIMMVNALAACQHLLIPVQTEFLAIKGLDRMLHTLDMIGHARGGVPPYTIVPTFFDKRTRASTDALRHLRDQHHDHLWPRVIPVDTRFREASKSGKPINMYSPEARGTQAYASLLRWYEHLHEPLPQAASL